MTIREKVVYQTADGKCFSDEASAKRHENIEAAYSDAHEKHACHGTFEFTDTKEFVEFVCKYADMIREDHTKELERLLEWSLDFMAKNPPKIGPIGEDFKNLNDANDILDREGEYK